MPQDREAEPMLQARKQGDDPVIKAKRGGTGARAQRSVGKKKKGGGGESKRREMA